MCIQKQYKAFRKLILFSSILFVTTGCVHMQIKNIRRNEAKHAYEFNVNSDTTKMIAKKTWTVLRHPVSKEIITDPIEADKIIEAYNSQQADLSLTDLYLLPKAFNYGKYNSGVQYFIGIQCLKKQQYDSALGHFAYALKLDRQLRYFSDINYLMAVCNYGIGDTNKARSQYDEFIKYSESIIPVSFCNDKTTNILNIGQLRDQGVESSSLYSGHFTDSLKGPVLKHYPYYGFLSDKPLFIIGTTWGLYGERNGLLGFVAITLKDYNSYFEFNKDYFSINFNYQLFRSWDNRLGAVAGVTYLNTHFIDGTHDIYSQNYALGIQTGYFLLPRLCVFTGGKYYYWNENHKHSAYGCKIWNENNAFIGVGVFVWESLALVGKYSRNNEMQVGISLFGMELFYNLSDKKGFNFGY